MSRAKEKKTGNQSEQTIDFDKLFISLVNLPPKVIKCILSYIRKDCLVLFLECNALVQFILHYIEKHVEIVLNRKEISGPLVWRTFDSVILNICLLIKEVNEIIKKYNIFPNEATICLAEHVVAMIEEDKNNEEGQETNAANTRNRRLRYDQETYNRLYQEKLTKWCLNNQELLRKIKKWNIEDELYQGNGAGILTKITQYMNLKSIKIQFLEYDDELDKETCIQIMNDIPDSIFEIRILMDDELKNFNFLKYSSLKKLEVPITSHNQINLLPSTLESLSIYIPRRGIEVTFDADDKVPPNLENFVVSVGYGFRGLGMLIQQMKKLKSFKIRFAGEIDNLKSLCLPDSDITSLIFESCEFNDYELIRKYKNLKTLSILRSDFPKGLFVSESDFPHLRTFEYLPNTLIYYNFRFGTPPESENSSTILNDKVIFPPNLRNISIEGDITIDNWVPPKDLLVLSLTQSRFPKGIKFKLPDTLILLQITGSTLKSLNNFHFPKRLKLLNMSGNRFLKSMKNTNLKHLEELFGVEFLNTAITESDRPNNQIQYKFNNFTSPKNENDRYNFGY